ncbi:MAG: GNAT family N-acetyltransferase [bacterium]|nr:GNAT family N-acetyltransferase [bacterium]
MKSTSAPIRITQATPEDVLGMQEVFYKTWLATYPNVEYGITVEDIRERWKNRLDDEYLAKRREQMANPPIGELTLAARDGNLVVGVCRVINLPNKNQLQALYVLPEYQGRGVGTTLWEEGRKFLDATRDIEVWVATYNTKAIAFYQHLGFRETGETDLDEHFKMPISGNVIPEIGMVLKAEPAS